MILQLTVHVWKEGGMSLKKNAVEFSGESYNPL